MLGPSSSAMFFETTIFSARLVYPLALLQILSSQKTPYHQIRDREIDGKLISPRSKDYCPKKRGYFFTKKFLCSDRRPPQCFLRQQSFPRG